MPEKNAVAFSLPKTRRFIEPISFKKIFFLLIVFLPDFLVAQPQIALSKAYWHTGKVKEGALLKEKLVISNIGNEVLEIKIRQSCECISLSFTKRILKPKSKSELIITYDTTGFSGQKNEYLFIDTNDPKNPYITWLIEADIVSVKKSTQDEKSSQSKNEEDLSQGQPKLSIEIYTTPNCSYCIKLKEKIIPEIGRKHKIIFEIKEYDLSIPKNYERFVLLEEKYQDKNNKLPAVFIGGKIFGGKKEINDKLEKEISSILNMSHVQEMISVENEIRKRLSSLKVLPIIFAGLIDGLNPCAFAAIVFLIAYLGMIHKKRTIEIFWTGIMFILGVFMIYILIGLGLSRFFLSIYGLKNISRVVYIIAGVITFILAVLSFSDFFSIIAIEKGKQAKVILQLPNYFRWKIYSLVEKYAKVRFLVPFGFFLGTGVSFLEFFCTGQIYLPTIMYMVGIPEMRVKAFLYLSLYSSMFVFPLILIFVSLLFGYKSEKIEELGRQHIKTVKFATGLIFLVLSILMFIV